MYVSYVRDIAIQQDHTILFPIATFSTYVATNFFSNFTEKCQYYQQTKVQLIFYPFLDKKNFKKIQFFLVVVFLVQRLNPQLYLSLLRT